jgi:flagellar hook-associated protein 3 FlgL
MRVTTRMAVGTLVSNLDRSYERITRFQSQLSSGSRLNSLSDDPAAVERSLALRSELRNIEQFQKNLSDGVGWLELSEATLNEMEGLFVEVRGLAVQGATSTYNASQRNAIADQVDQFLEHSLSLSEARYRGRYVFSGTQTGSVPYQAQRDASGQIVDVVARGDASGSIEREVSDGIVMQVNIPGRDVFENPSDIRVSVRALADEVGNAEGQRLIELFGQGERVSAGQIRAVLDDPAVDPPLSADLREALEGSADDLEARETNPFSALVELRDALRANDADAVRGTLDKLANVREHISSMRGQIGARVNRMQTTQNVLDRIAVEMNSVLSEDEDVDLSSTIVNLTQEQDVFQAALASGNTIIPQSLMDFI